MKKRDYKRDVLYRESKQSKLTNLMSLKRSKTFNFYEKSGLEKSAYELEQHLEKEKSRQIKDALRKSKSTDFNNRKKKDKIKIPNTLKIMPTAMTGDGSLDEIPSIPSSPNHKSKDKKYELPEIQRCTSMNSEFTLPQAQFLNNGHRNSKSSPSKTRERSEITKDHISRKSSKSTTSRPHSILRNTVTRTLSTRSSNTYQSTDSYTIQAHRERNRDQAHIRDIRNRMTSGTSGTTASTEDTKESRRNSN